jgi:tetrahydromethanopterin S-methyltransferase subunit G
MVVMAPREKWTDERLDDLSGKVDKGFERTERAIAETKAEIKELRGETKAEIQAGFARVDSDIREVNARLDALNRNLFVVAGAIIAALIGVNAF